MTIKISSSSGFSSTDFYPRVGSRCDGQKVLLTDHGAELTVLSVAQYCCLYGDDVSIARVCKKGKDAGRRILACFVCSVRGAMHCVLTALIVGL